MVGACVLVASVVGVGALGADAPRASPNADAPTADPTIADAQTADAETTTATGDRPLPETTTATGDRLLVVADAETDERLLAVPVSEGTTVALNYTHSVEKTPVLDVYEVNGTELEMVRMEFQSYGAGLPSRADVNITENGTFVFDPEGSYDHVYVKPGEIAGHELIIDDRTYDLVALSDAQSVNVYVTNRSETTSTHY